eukprot:g466.t1
MADEGKVSQDMEGKYDDDEDYAEDNLALDEDVEDEEELDEEDREIYRLIGNNPAMQRVQAALKKQLSEHHDRIEIALLEEEEQVKRVKQEREDVGVELYGAQQQLARLQMDLENRHARVSQARDTREEIDNKLVDMQKDEEDIKFQLKDIEAAVKEKQEELDSLSSTLIQVERYNEGIKGEIAVTRRATYKAEEMVGQLEKKKGEQDLLIDHLQETLKSKQEELGLYKAQYISQAQETKVAVTTLQDAGSEMEQISFEKKQLVQQWRTALIGMKKRDEALTAQMDEINQMREDTKGFNSSIGSVKMYIEKQQRESETLTGVKQKLDREIENLKNKIEENRVATTKLVEQHALLEKSLEETEKRFQASKEETKLVVQQEQLLVKKYEVLQRQKHTVEQEITLQHGGEITVNKAVANLLKDVKKAQERVHQKEIEASNVENELARIKVDSLNAQSHNEQLEKTLESLVQDLHAKDKLIEKYENEIRQRNDEIEKKMYAVDRLNRKYEALTADVEEENLGPLEATIKNIENEKTKHEDNSREKQKMWLTAQTELVDVVADTEIVENESHELVSKDVIIRQKAIRIDRDIERTQRSIKQVKAAVSSLHTDMTRLNSLNSENEALAEDLANKYYVTEMEFVRELQELEEQSKVRSEKIANIKAEKEQLLEDIVELEKQALLWEKKIILEKETQKALDPTVGQSEAKMMQKEIHRMELRHEALKREQEKMIKEMERAVAKREIISLKYSSRASSGTTKQALQKRLRRLNKDLRQFNDESKEHQNLIDEKLQTIDKLGSSISEAFENFAELETDTNELQNEINNKLYKKQQYMDKLAHKRKFVERCERAIARGDPNHGPQDEVAAEEQLQNEVEQQRSLRKILATLKSDENLKHMQEVFNRVEKLLEI